MKVLLVLTILFLSCNEPLQNKNLDTQTLASDTSKDSYEKILEEREAASTDKQTDSLGTLVTKISFKVTTNNKKDFEDGIRPWVSIENPAKDLPNLIDRNMIVIPDTSIAVIIDYPLIQQYKFKMTSKTGFTREKL